VFRVFLGLWNLKLKISSGMSSEEIAKLLDVRALCTPDTSSESRRGVESKGICTDPDCRNGEFISPRSLRANTSFELYPDC
jgi:hypothetical protein